MESIFKGISEEDLACMLNCFSPAHRTFHAGEQIMTYSDHLDKMGLLESGSAHLGCIDADGKHNLLESFETHDVFGEMFAMPIDGLEYIVQADTDCSVMFISYNHIIKRCQNACAHHSQLVSNLFEMVAHKAQLLTLHINILSRRTLRQKLLAYFAHMESVTGSDRFELPITLTKLADYLCVDRSSMMRELRKLNEEGILRSSGRNITMLQSGTLF
ncbi:MAG: Crp/Fnr family transcriptional regulator [Oscillospiraceae bacterium]|nr:Crp/Fnr family transcriptional regulator [Oscillospiraceae bacterium]